MIDDIDDGNVSKLFFIRLRERNSSKFAIR